MSSENEKVNQNYPQSLHIWSDKKEIHTKNIGNVMIQ
jgi:hypothetical protein